MKQHSAQEDELRRYLLDDLTPGERLEVEERLFLDEEYLRMLRATEDELLDEYVYDEMTADERGKVETRFLPGWREDLRLARALKRYASSEPARV
jgi:anti-sigma factor RsiW